MLIIDTAMVGREFDSALDRLGASLRLCPDDLWPGSRPSGTRATIRSSGWTSI